MKSTTLEITNLGPRNIISKSFSHGDPFISKPIQLRSGAWANTWAMGCQLTPGVCSYNERVRKTGKPIELERKLRSIDSAPRCRGSAKANTRARDRCGERRPSTSFNINVYMRYLSSSSIREYAQSIATTRGMFLLRSMSRDKSDLIPSPLSPHCDSCMTIDDHKSGNERVVSLQCRQTYESVQAMITFPKLETGLNSECERCQYLSN